jgi:hypothetical protein
MSGALSRSRLSCSSCLRRVHLVNKRRRTRTRRGVVGDRGLDRGPRQGHRLTRQPADRLEHGCDAHHRDRQFPQASRQPLSRSDLRGSQLPDLDPTLDLRGALVTVEQAVAFAVSLGLDVGPAADTEV